MDISIEDKELLVKDILPMEYNVLGDVKVKKIINNDLERLPEAKGGYNYDIGSTADFIALVLTIAANTLAILASFKSTINKEDIKKIAEKEVDKIVSVRKINLIEKNVIINGITNSDVIIKNCEKINSINKR